MCTFMGPQGKRLPPGGGGGALLAPQPSNAMASTLKHFSPTSRPQSAILFRAVSSALLVLLQLKHRYDIFDVSLTSRACWEVLLPSSTGICLAV